MRRNKGFTLVELLTVIAIIAILTAVLFPVFARAKNAAKEAAEKANLGQIHEALKLYRADQGGYPPLLLQVAEYDPSTNMLRQVKELRRAYLYDSRVKDIKVFTSIISQASHDGLVNACWPNQDPRPLGVGEVLEQRQLYGPSNEVTYLHLGIDPTALNGDLPGDPARFYEWDNYDVSPTENPNCVHSYELRYTLFWTEWGQGGGGPNDNPRQLGYNEPPEDTVVTWNSWFRMWENDPNNPGQRRPQRINKDIVLFLSGTIRHVDSIHMYERSWRLGQ